MLELADGFVVELVGEFVVELVGGFVVEFVGIFVVELVGRFGLELAVELLEATEELVLGGCVLGLGAAGCCVVGLAEWCVSEAAARPALVLAEVFVLELVGALVVELATVCCTVKPAESHVLESTEW